MRGFSYSSPTDWREAVSEATVRADSRAQSSAQYLAGGTTLLDLMKIDVMHPARLIDVRQIAGREFQEVAVRGNDLWLGALVTMAAAAANETVSREFPVIAQSLNLAASAQLRNMARLGGNVLQRTRCHYFRDTRIEQCNKRDPGSGCAALDGINRSHAILGAGESCIATYPGDFAQALIALDARVATTGPMNGRPFAALHRRPGTTPHVETELVPGELITGFLVSRVPWFRRSVYVKIRDRQSYQFALASAAVALDLESDRVRSVRIALGGVASVPWRATASEAALTGQPLDEATAEHAAALAFADARTKNHSRFKVALGEATIVRALLAAKELEP